jgi:hypothetical protein
MFKVWAIERIACTMATLSVAAGSGSMSERSILSVSNENCCRYRRHEIQD